MKWLIPFFACLPGLFAQELVNTNMQVTLYDIRSEIPQPARIHFGQRFIVKASYRNASDTTYAVFWDSYWQSNRVPGAFYSGGSWCRPGTGTVSYYVGFQKPTQVDEIRFYAHPSDGENSLNYAVKYEWDRIPIRCEVTEPRPDIAPNPLFQDVAQISFHPDLPGIQAVEKALLDIGLKHPGYSACRTTYPVVLIEGGVPVEAAQAVLQICVDHLPQPLRDIQLEPAPEGQTGGTRIYIGVRHKPRYERYPEDKLRALLEPGLTQRQFHELIDWNLPPIE